MNTKGRLFTGVIALILIATGCIIPLYIADKWRDIETSGTSAVEISSLFRNGTGGGNSVIAYEQFNTSTDVLSENIYNPSFSGTVCMRYYSYPGGGTMSPGYTAWTTEDADGYTDIIPFPASCGASSNNYICYFYHYSAYKGLDDGSSIIRIKFNIKNGDDDLNWKFTNIHFGYTPDGTGFNPAVLGSTNYGPTFTPSLVNGEREFWINLTGAELYGIASQQAPANSYDDRKCMRIIVQFSTGSNYLPVAYSSFETYQSYYEESTGEYNDTWTNETVYVGSDVSVSYLDIQTWILGASGVGIGIMALACSPYWNPIKNYRSPVPNRGRRRKR